MKDNEVRQHRRLQVFSRPAVIRAAMIALSVLPAVFPQATGEHSIFTSNLRNFRYIQGVSY
jgi:hypothetical protein